MLQHVSKFPFFSRPSNTPLCKQTTFCLSIIRQWTFMLRLPFGYRE